MFFFYESFNKPTPERLVKGTRGVQDIAHQDLIEQISYLRQTIGFSRRELSFLLKLPVRLMARVESGKEVPDSDCCQRLRQLFIKYQSEE